MIFKNPVLSDGITESTFECKRDGLTIRGTIYRPKGDHLPIAIVCHGFMAWQDSVKHYAAFYGGIRAKCLRSLQNFFYIFQGVLGRNSYADVIRSE